MARGAQKRIASGNASAVTTLTYGFLVSNTVYLLGNYGLWRTPASFTATSIARYVVTEAIAAFLGWQLTSMAHAGEDLAQSGLTAYMFDVVYITWFVHIASTLVSRVFWWTYAVVGRFLTQIPAYAAYLLYTHILRPYVFGRGAAPAASTPAPAAGAPADAPAVSKRQAKQQARASRGGRRTAVRT
ncbi:hypothetical protein CBS9595_003911 [Malassezia furfur]|nr:hypothetical protein CBS9595_003911 [Malassezia furfur]